MRYSSHTGRPKYPYTYAAGIVDAFIDNYARATNLVAKICGISGKELRLKLIGQFMYRNTRWNCSRDVIKWCDDPIREQYLCMMSREEALNYLTAVKTLAEDYEIFEKKSYSTVDNS